MTTVIVPVYNGAATIEACLRSVMTQTGAELELIVIDDGSMDDTSAICLRLAAEDRRLRLFRQKNAGVSAARNRGLREARGTYVTFLDADDLLPPGAVEVLEQAAEQGADFVIGSHVYFRGRWERPTIHGPEDPLDSLMSLMCGKLYRRDILLGKEIRFREGLPYGEDTLFNLQYYRHATETAVLSRIVCRCRMGGAASACRYYPERAEIARSLVEAYGEFCDEGALRRIAENELTETALHYLLHCPRKEAREKTAAARQLLSAFLQEDIPADTVLRRHWRKLLLRKLRKRLMKKGTTP